MDLLQLGAIADQNLFDNLLLFGYKALVFAVILGAGWVAGRLTGSLIAGFVRRIGADTVFRKTAIGRSISRAGLTAPDFSRIVAKIIVYVTSILIAFHSLEIPLVTETVQTVLFYIPTAAFAIIVLIIGFIFSDWVGEFIKKSVTPEERQAFYVDVLGNIVKITLYFITITITLSLLKVDVTILYIIAQTFAWAVAIAVGVASGIVVGWLLKDRIKELLHI